MIRLGLSARDRRTAIVGVTVVGLLTGLSRGLPALAEWERGRLAAASDATTRAASAHAMAHMLPALRDSLRSRRRELAAVDSTMFMETSSSAIVADLAAALDDIAASARFRVTAMQLRADSVAAGALARVAVRVTGTTDVAGLADFVRVVEGGSMPLVVREVTVSQPEPAAPDARAEVLRVEVLVETIARIVATRAT